MSRVRVGLTALALAGALAAVTACTGGGNDVSSDSTSLADKDPGDCIAVDMAVSPEKITVLTELAKTFNDGKVKVGSKCIFVRPYSKSSGAAATLLAQGWPDPQTNGSQPVVWSPAARGWGQIVNQRLSDAGQAPIVPASATPFMLTPLVIAMPKPMADALGYPAKPIGFKDIVDLANDPQGWAKFGKPEWGPFKLGKTNPNFSTSGLNFTIAEYYAATGKKNGLSTEDLERPDVEAFAESVEQAVVHYGDITMTFLNNWFRADARGTALTYASAVAIEEKSVIDYNSGNPDGVLSPGEVPRKPRVPLVAVYPKEGTLFSDSPFMVLNAPWVTDEQKQAAQKFEEFVQRPENQEKVLQFGFRPGNPSVPVQSPIVAANGVNPAEPSSVLEVPSPPVLTKILDKWAQQRKTARVLLVIDVSGSMGDPATEDGDDTKLDLAKRAAISSLDQFKDDDEVGLWVFSTDLPGAKDAVYREVMPVAPIGTQREQMRREIDDLFPVNGTPLYDVTGQAFTAMSDAYDPKKINAVVLLTDGMNDDGNKDDDARQLNGLIEELRVGSEGANTRPVRIFPISYGVGADLATLRRIAEASTGAVYDASNPATIEQVFNAVVSNF